jgi:cysteinyl-tRNA synthetase
MDFVLWKPSKEGEPGWPSPCGIKTPGRPGWHIECSAMSWKHLGETFDIHGGGIDLVFPHHENELAQSRCAFHSKVMANVWMHNGFLQVEGEKMSKSLGNFITIRQLLDDGWPGEAIRLNMLKTHYRQPLDWTLHSLEESLKTIREWTSLAVAMNVSGYRDDEIPNRPVDDRLQEALSDDLNTPKAVAVIHSLSNAVAHDLGHTAITGFTDALRFLGLYRDGLAEILDRRNMLSSVDKATVVQLVDARLAARKAKDFKESDRIRDELTKMGVVLKDNKDGTTTWEVAR